MVLDLLKKNNIRLDQFLYYIRLFKSRNLASKFITYNRLRISGQVTQKPHRLVSIGDILTLLVNDKLKIIEVIDIPNRRGPYLESLNFYKDLTPIEKKENKLNISPNVKFVERVGRPTKLERRQTDKLMGRD